MFLDFNFDTKEEQRCKIVLLTFTNPWIHETLSQYKNKSTCNLSTICIHWNADSLLENLTAKRNNY